ncbi:CG32152, partial [Drosophila busckii]
RGRGHRRVKHCPRIPTPPRTVPTELRQVDSMTSADFRHDFAAHVDNMRTRQKNQQHMHFFQTLMEENQHLLKNRNLLVLNCGTGTLALMAARAGAAQVYAVDYSLVTNYAQLVVKQNNYEHIIKVLHGHVSQLKLPERVDGIICNWMGHCLLYESELLQLLQARERWLKPGGFIMPDMAALYLLGSAEYLLKNERCNWWLNVYNFNMRALRRYALAEPRYAKIKGEHLLTKAHKVLSLNLNTVSLEQLHINKDIKLQVQHDGFCECFVLYFDVAFSRAHQPLTLSCNPCLQTNYKSPWLQTVLFVEQSFMMRAQQEYKGRLVFQSLAKPGEAVDLLHMKFEIELHEHDKNDSIGRALVLKSWNMMPRFQTLQEVADCQD